MQIPKHNTYSPIVATPEILIIDSAIDDYASLLKGVRSPLEVIILDGKRDGISQITEILGKRQRISSLHLVSHGSSGSIQLGNSYLSVETLNNYVSDLQKWSKAFTTQAELLIYGCEVAKGEKGRNLIARLSELTGAKIAASITKTGSITKGGNWELEVNTGIIQSPLAFEASVRTAYTSVLAQPNDTWKNA
jgi:hypothetical protein